MIDPRRLPVLRALADHGTVTAAAQALHLTPSAVSQQLSALEAECGQQLLRRHGRRVELTPAGEQLVVHANAVAEELERAEATLAALDAGLRGLVRVASFASAITTVVAPAIRRLRNTAPSVSLMVRDVEGHVSIPLLLDGETDLAITEDYRLTPGQEDSRLSRFPLYAEPFDVVLPTGHRLAAEAEVEIEALAGDDWIAPQPGNPCRDVLTLVCPNPRIEHTSDDFRAITGLVAAGAGVALVPRNAFAAMSGAIARPLRGEAPFRRVFAATRRGSAEHPLIDTVLSVLRDAAHDTGDSR